MAKVNQKLFFSFSQLAPACLLHSTRVVVNAGVHVEAFTTEVNLLSPVDTMTWSTFGDVFGWLGGLERSLNRALLCVSDLQGQRCDSALLPAQNLLHWCHLCQTSQQPQLQHW